MKVYNHLTYASRYTDIIQIDKSVRREKNQQKIIHLINSFLVDGDIMGKWQQTEPNDYEEILYQNNTKQKL